MNHHDDAHIDLMNMIRDGHAMVTIAICHLMGLALGPQCLPWTLKL